MTDKTDSKNTQNLYCSDLFLFSRRKTWEVTVGKIRIGGDNPVRIQTMVTTPTMDIEATVNECIKVFNAGAELVRITAPGIRDAEALGIIRQKLRDGGYDFPLIADIHFNPDAAETAARNVEKIRINPGNFTDRQAMLQTSNLNCEYDWDADLEKLETKFVSLLNICKEYGTALRIGANHGSLSGRIMSRYGDTPEGMVESAMEFLRICKNENFHNVIVSMKASNTRVMVYAYRLLVAAMNAEDMYFPLHLGVTEAGNDEDGRIKSAVGIGALLADGLGDTVRVSLTEPPENEIPVAKTLVHYFEKRKNCNLAEKIDITGFNPYGYVKQRSHAVNGIGGDNPVAVISDLSHLNPVYQKDIENLGFKSGSSDSDSVLPDFIYTASSAVCFERENLKILDDNDNNLIFCNYRQICDKQFQKWLAINSDKILIISSDNDTGIAELRACFLKIKALGISNPVIINRKYDETDFEKLQLMAAADFGALLIDGFGAGIMISAKSIPVKLINDLSFRILQASRVRYTRTEYIACPSCGRTLFDLKTTLQNIKNATQNFKSLKIGIMGCIVNGPGEMADADYGYVGAGHGKITLYRGKEPVKKNIPQENAIDELIKLINSEQ
ncbi:MAG: (E)-4-hydroxy-3-methylbut-2-enyl-diphosphate synthase [Prevotellaceae bacterium]|jgi:(E)-4-hydroxy-3-methylbut-2-enyl-diphosphate synthase|nr:(E)-4-hydroxy-3-methylbut-2-enyl-diphosphate synthase [Prevotellaceae bacterium]